MRHQNLFKRVIAIVLIILVLIGCVGPSKPKTGYWEGEMVSFIVTEGGTITDFKITIGNCEVTMDEEIVIDFSDSLGSFIWNPEGALLGNRAETATDFSAEAKFESETSLSGTYSYEICGGFMNLTKPTDVPWTAEWQRP